jgi:hypothetical protein
MMSRRGTGPREPNGVWTPGHWALAPEAANARRDQQAAGGHEEASPDEWARATGVPLRWSHPPEPAGGSEVFAISRRFRENSVGMQLPGLGGIPSLAAGPRTCISRYTSCVWIETDCLKINRARETPLIGLNVVTRP